MILDKLRNWQSDCDKKLLSLDSDEMTFYNHLVSLNGDCDSDENCGWEENVRGDEEGRKEDQVARHLHLDDHHQRWHHIHHDCLIHDDDDGHLEGAQWLDHVAEDEEDVGDAEAAEQPVEEGGHWPGGRHCDDNDDHDDNDGDYISFSNDGCTSGHLKWNDPVGQLRAWGKEL